MSDKSNKRKRSGSDVFEVSSKPSAKPIPQLLDNSLLEKAVRALLKHASLKQQEERDRLKTRPLFEEDELIYLTITLKKVPEKGKVKPITIPIPHPITNEDSEICIFTKDPQKEFKKIILDLKIPNVKKVISLTKLRRNYKTFKLKRELEASYDLFLTDDRIVHFLPALLGKAFFCKKKVRL